MKHIIDFTDYDSIPEEHRTAVESCVAHNIISGKDTGAFDPNGTVTFGEFCKMICVIENYGKDPNFSLPYTNLGDRETGHWAGQYIQRCREHKIYIKDGNKCCPDQFVRYNDMHIMLSNTYQFFTGKCRHMEYTQISNPYIKVTRSIIAFEIFTLCQDIARHFSRDLDPYFIPELIDLSKFYYFITFLPANYSNISYIFNFAFNMDCTEQDIPFEEVYQLIKYKDENLLKCGDEESIYHFTNLNTLKALFISGARFRLSNAEFLNDPSEGQILVKQITEYLKNAENSGINPELGSWLSDIDSPDFNGPFHANNTYIASFMSTDLTSSPENLPMWYTYADNCKGCALKLSIYSGSDYSKRYPLYKIRYTPEEANDFVAGYIKVLNESWEKVGTQESKSAILFRTIALDILTQCSYLFKHSSFNYEHEARAIIFCSPKDAKKEDLPREGELFCRTYCEVPFHIDHVIFGPAVPDPKRLAVCLTGMGIDCTFEKSNIPFTVV